jgi:uncharacterized protein YebE (UPF0316 family)
MNETLLNWVILPLLIFLARFTDVSLGTLRIMFIARGKKKIAPLLGFFEVLIWLVAISQIMKNLNNVACYIAWAGGFATGNYVGILIEERIAIGLQVVRIITPKPAQALIATLREKGFGVTSLDAHGALGDVNLLFTIIRRRDLKEISTLILEFDPTAFYSVEDIRSASEQFYGPVQTSGSSRASWLSRLFPIRIGK